MNAWPCPKCNHNNYCMCCSKTWSVSSGLCILAAMILARLEPSSKLLRRANGTSKSRLSTLSVNFASDLRAPTFLEILSAWMQLPGASGKRDSRVPSKSRLLCFGCCSLANPRGFVLRLMDYPKQQERIYAGIRGRMVRGWSNPRPSSRYGCWVYASDGGQ